MSQIKTRDFSRTSSGVQFTADGYTHICRPALAPEVMQDVVALTRDKKITEDFGIVEEIFKQLMSPANFSEIQPRFRRDHENPLGLAQILEIIEWLIEEYAQRPTTPPATSSSPSQVEMDVTGTALTAGVQPLELTHSA
jgi:hypothetical protein